MPRPPPLLPVASTRFHGWGGTVSKGMGCGKGVPLPQNFFLFCGLEWHIFVNYEMLNLKYGNNIGGYDPTYVPQTKILDGMCPRHPRRD